VKVLALSSFKLTPHTIDSATLTERITHDQYHRRVLNRLLSPCLLTACVRIAFFPATRSLRVMVQKPKKPKTEAESHRLMLMIL